MQSRVITLSSWFRALNWKVRQIKDTLNLIFSSDPDYGLNWGVVTGGGPNLTLDAIVVILVHSHDHNQVSLTETDFIVII